MVNMHLKTVANKEDLMKKVSVIVPAYNVEKYIRRCLNSLVEQTLSDIEIIVIDDGSSDNTYSVVSSYAQKDSRIRLIKQNNQKQGAARNRGLEIAQGEFITFVDSDDWIDLDYLEKLYNVAVNSNCDIAIAGSTRNYEKKVKEHLTIKNSEKYYGTNEILRAIQNNLVVWGKLFKFEVIRNLRFEEGVFYEDAPYAIRAIHLAKSAVTVPDAVYHYFSNPTSTIKQKLSEKNKNDKISTNLDLINYCEENNIDIGNWSVLKERHLLWGIKHYKYFKDYYFFGLKFFRRNIPFDNSKIFVVYNTACFGDVLLCNSLCQNIKQIFPDSKTVFITDKKFKDAALYQKDVDEVVIYDKKGVNKGLFGFIKFIKEFKYKKSYASIITYNNYRNWMISYVTGSRNIMMAERKKSDLSTQEKHNLLLQSLTNKKVKNYPIKYQLSEEVRRSTTEILSDIEDYVVLCTTSKNVVKDMPVETATQLIKQLNEIGQKVVFVGVGEKALEHARMLKESGCDFLDLTNKTTIPQLGAILEKSRCLISVDTGTMHLGCAVGIPTVAVFYEQGTLNNWAPKQELYKSVVIHENQTAESILNALKTIEKVN